MLSAPAANGTFPTIFSANPSLGALGPCHGGPVECICLFLPPRHRPSPRTLSRSASRFSPSKRFHDGSLFRDCSHFVIFGPPSLRASQIAPTAATYRRGAAEAFTSLLNMLRYSACIGHANHPPRQLVVWGLTPHKIHSLVGCSSVRAIFHQLTSGLARGEG